jgi:hypothetical protein
VEKLFQIAHADKKIRTTGVRAPTGRKSEWARGDGHAVANWNFNGSEEAVGMKRENRGFLCLTLFGWFHDRNLVFGPLGFFRQWDGGHLRLLGKKEAHGKSVHHQHLKSLQESGIVNNSINALKVYKINMNCR